MCIVTDNFEFMLTIYHCLCIVVNAYAYWLLLTLTLFAYSNCDCSTYVDVGDAVRSGGHDTRNHMAAAGLPATAVCDTTVPPELGSATILPVLARSSVTAVAHSATVARTVRTPGVLHTSAAAPTDYARRGVDGGADHGSHVGEEGKAGTAES